MQMRNLLIATTLTLIAAGSAHAQQPPAPPSCADNPAYRQLDFWVGDWDLEYDAGNGQLARASNHITKDELGACVITEHFAQASTNYVGNSHSIYDRQTGEWRQTWVDNQGAVVVLTGGPVSGQPYAFELKTAEPRGLDKALKRMIWQDVTPDSLTWRWQTLAPDGAWKDLWLVRYKRRR
jgi:hypothetical protein